LELEEGYYRLLVRVTQVPQERHGVRMESLPGMTATVEIKTGQKTVLEYIFRPLQSVSQALRER
jgi:adhesin transport system membrane fusion protein